MERRGEREVRERGGRGENHSVGNIKDHKALTHNKQNKQIEM